MATGAVGQCPAHCFRTPSAGQDRSNLSTSWPHSIKATRCLVKCRCAAHQQAARSTALASTPNAAASHRRRRLQGRRTASREAGAHCCSGSGERPSLTGFIRASGRDGAHSKTRCAHTGCITLGGVVQGTHCGCARHPAATLGCRAAAGRAGSCCAAAPAAPRGSCRAHRCGCGGRAPHGAGRRGCRGAAAPGGPPPRRAPAPAPRAAPPPAPAPAACPAPGAEPPPALPGAGEPRHRATLCCRCCLGCKQAGGASGA